MKVKLNNKEKRNHKEKVIIFPKPSEVSTRALKNRSISEIQNKYITKISLIMK